MTTLAKPDLPRATDGEIAAVNLESARRGAWARFAADARLSGAAEAIVYNENLAVQFLGDLDALARLEALASQFARVGGSFRAALVQAEVASATHRFDDARNDLGRAASMGGPSEAIERHTLTIDQATRSNRFEIARASLADSDAGLAPVVHAETIGSPLAPPRGIQV